MVGYRAKNRTDREAGMEDRQRALAVYAAVTYILWAVTYTMMDIPFWSMLPAFPRPGRQREAMTSLSRTAASLSSMGAA